jgi:hypothetical protein
MSILHARVMSLIMTHMSHVSIVSAVVHANLVTSMLHVTLPTSSSSPCASLYRITHNAENFTSVDPLQFSSEMHFSSVVSLSLLARCTREGGEVERGTCVCFCSQFACMLPVGSTRTRKEEIESASGIHTHTHTLWWRGGTRVCLCEQFAYMFASTRDRECIGYSYAYAHTIYILTPWHT